MQAFEWLLSWLALGGVWALSRGHRQGWLVAALASLGYVSFCWGLKLPGQALVQFSYFSTQLWGWWHWKKHPRFRFERRSYLLLFLILPIGLTLMQVVSVQDAWLAAASLVVQAMTALGWANAWRLWVLLDCLTAGLFAVHQAWATAVLYLIFAGVAESAHRYWRNQATEAGP